MEINRYNLCSLWLGVTVQEDSSLLTKSKLPFQLSRLIKTFGSNALFLGQDISSFAAVPAHVVKLVDTLS